METNEEQMWKDLELFYENNKQVIKKSLAMDVAAAGGKDDRAAELESAINTFVDTADVIMDGLVLLANIHPVLNVAIFTFRAIIKLDIARRDNDKKVVAVKLQMQNMMCTMFQIRALKYDHAQDAEGDRAKAGLRQLVEGIANDIKKCASDLNFYTDKKSISRYIKSKTYERQFADHIQTFVQRRSELQNMLSVYTATGIDAANMAIQHAEQKIDAVAQKLDKLFRKLDSPREREILIFIEQNGGPEECIKKDELLTNLLEKAGEPLETGKSTVLREELAAFRKTLTKELNENLTEVLNNNLSRFEKLLIVQNHNMERMSEQISTKLDKLISTSILKLKDPELQQIWDRMGLKRSVKAKNFVLTFRDHLPTDSLLQEGPTFPQPFLPLIGSEAPPSKPDADSDSWVFDFIDVAHVQPIVEAMDEDGSGFISVQEANKFALSRPKGMSLLLWIAYWAAGWHINIANYRTKIYSIIFQIYDAVASVHPANRYGLALYLDDDNFAWIESLLRSIKPPSYGAYKEPKLINIAESMATLQEQQLLSNLKEILFLVKSPTDASLVAGSGRVEAWILPLLYLLLDRHLTIIKLARTHVLSDSELSSHSTSFASIFDVFDGRMRQLEEIFSQRQRDVAGQFEIHAYGMFLSSFNKTANPLIQNTLLTKKEYFFYQSEPGEKDGVDIAVLTQGPGPTCEYEILDLNLRPPPPEHTTHPIEGAWIGTCIQSQSKMPSIAFQGSFEANFGPVVEGKIKGKGETYRGLLDFEGNVESAALATNYEGSSGSAARLGVLFKIVSPEYNIWCKGQYVPEKETMEGDWIVDASGKSAGFPSNGDDESQIRGHFLLTRTNPDIFRFRYILDGPEADPSWTVARKRWAFAIGAVLFQTRREKKAAEFVKGQIAERRTWIKLAIRDDLAIASSPKGLRLTWCIPPTNARVYQAHASYLYDRKAYDMCFVYCDACHRHIMFTHFQCIICTEEDFSNQVDLCAECIESLALNESKFSQQHRLSHSLIRSSNPILSWEKATITNRAKLLSESIKSSFRISEAEKRRMKENNPPNLKDSQEDGVVASQPVSSTPSLTCVCCKMDLYLPCWVCVTCDLNHHENTLICMDCERKGASVPERISWYYDRQEQHSRIHRLMRINDSFEIKAKASQLEQPLADMEERLNNRISTLEEKVNMTLDAVQVGPKSTPTKEAAEQALPRDTGSSGLMEQATDVEQAENSSHNGSSVALDSIPRLEQRLDRLEGKVDNLVSLMRDVLSAIPNGLSKTYEA